VGAHAAAGRRAAGRGRARRQRVRARPFAAQGVPRALLDHGRRARPGPPLPAAGAGAHAGQRAFYRARASSPAGSRCSCWDPAGPAADPRDALAACGYPRSVPRPGRGGRQPRTADRPADPGALRQAGRLRFLSHRDVARSVERASAGRRCPSRTRTGSPAPAAVLDRRRADGLGERGRVPRDRADPGGRPGAWSPPGRGAARRAWTCSRPPSPSRPPWPTGSTASRWEIALPGRREADAARRRGRPAGHGVPGRGARHPRRAGGRSTSAPRLVAVEVTGGLRPGAVTVRRRAPDAGVCAILTAVVRQTTPAVRPDDVLGALDVVAGLKPPVPAKATRMAQGLLTNGVALADPLGPTPGHLRGRPVRVVRRQTHTSRRGACGFQPIIRRPLRRSRFERVHATRSSTPRPVSARVLGPRPAGSTGAAPRRERLAAPRAARPADSVAWKFACGGAARRPCRAGRAASPGAAHRLRDPSCTLKSGRVRPSAGWWLEPSTRAFASALRANVA
jgi:hypothetical protein